MFDRLFDVLGGLLGNLKFVSVVDQFEAGVVLRYGRLHRKVGPGVHWFWPALEQLLRHPVVLDTQELGEQSLTTKDGHGVTLTGVITFRVMDVEQILLHVQGEQQALSDSAMGIIGMRVMTATWEELISEEFWLETTKRIRLKAEKYGIKVTQVQFRDLTKGRSLRIWNSSRSIGHVT